ncbi:MAG: hypothetical protein M3O46_23300 [Myxococcota bacterium]|nr:hypothetical protein [Myxococcota bacterium]
MLLSLAACATPSGRGATSTSEGGSPRDASSEPASPYTQVLLQSAHIGSDSAQTDFQSATADVMLVGAPFANVNLVVDLVSPCFPWSNWQTDRPPAMQHYPADCDAFDRTFEISVIDPAAHPGMPGIEVVRAITPFGGPQHVEQDVTDVFNTISGPRTLQVHVGAYLDPKGLISGSAGAWYVSAHLDVTPGMPKSNVLAIVPLYYGSVTSGQTLSDVPFTLPAETIAGRLEYRVTGHGGTTADGGTEFRSCFGPADEFCRRLHHILVDDNEVVQVTPWRNTCDVLCTLTDGGPFGGQYCLENPCGDPESVKASRANWCPGSVTPPLSWTPASLSSPGAHTFRFAIDGVPPGAEWRVSAVVYAYGH